MKQWQREENHFQQSNVWNPSKKSNVRQLGHKKIQVQDLESVFFVNILNMSFKRSRNSTPQNYVVLPGFVSVKSFRL